MDPLDPRSRYQVRYLKRGKVSHLIEPQRDLNSFPYEESLCERSPNFGEAWLGSGSQQEHDEAARRSLCGDCCKADPKYREWLDHCALVAEKVRIALSKGLRKET